MKRINIPFRNNRGSSYAESLAALLVACLAAAMLAGVVMWLHSSEKTSDETAKEYYAANSVMDKCFEDREEESLLAEGRVTFEDSSGMPVHLTPEGESGYDALIASNEILGGAPSLAYRLSPDK